MAETERVGVSLNSRLKIYLLAILFEMPLGQSGALKLPHWQGDFSQSIG